MIAVSKVSVGRITWVGVLAGFSVGLGKGVTVGSGTEVNGIVGVEVEIALV
jgi:hypothetical protein